MHNKEQITKEAVIEPTRIHMLSNEERLRYDIAPKERLALMDEDTYEELVAVWAYACLKSKYKDVYRIGGVEIREGIFVHILIYHRINMIYINANIIKMH